MADDNNQKVSFVDVAAGAGTGAVVATSTAAIYGMTTLKKVDSEKLLGELLSTGEKHAKNLPAVLKKLVKDSPLAGISVDQEKLRSSIQASLEARGINPAEIGGNASELAQKISARFTSEEAKTFYAEIQQAAAESIKIEGFKNLTPDSVKKLLGAIQHLAEKGEAAPLLKVFEEHGIKVDEAKLKTMYTSVVEQPFLKETFHEVKEAAKDLGAKAGFPAAEGANTIVDDVKQAVADSVKINGKSEADVRKIISGGPAAITAEFMSMIDKTIASGKKAAIDAATAFGVEAQGPARTLVASKLYDKAKWYEKPVVAFEAMSSKGKVGLGAAVIGATALGTWASAQMSSRNNGSAERGA